MAFILLRHMKKNEIITIFSALVWSINGFACKLLNLVPRHQEIVAQISGNEYALILTKIIGFLELLLAIWILSRYKSRLSSILQVILVITMNIIEFTLVPDLLLFGKLNLIFAILFVGLILVNEFVLKPKTVQHYGL